MARIVSLVVLVVILLIIAGLFFEVMANFLLPLFLALLLVVMFGPLKHWFKSKCRGHDRIAALLTTASILLIVLIPLVILLIEAGFEAQSLYRTAMDGQAAAELQSAVPSAADPTLTSGMNKLADWAAGQIVDLGGRFGLDLKSEDMKTAVADRVQQFLAPMALRTTRFLGAMLVDLGIMVLAVYYFFADGPAMIQTILRLSPLEGNRTQELLEQFDSVTRAVVVATLLSAFVQGLLAGVGFYAAGTGSVFLLTGLCMLFTLVPFVGAAIVWVPVCLWLFAVEHRTLAAVLLAGYCIGVVSMVDNVVKPAVLHGRSNLHPLLALLSVLGGVQALGPIGIFVGPMVVAFLQTLLNMVHAELNSMSKA